MVSARKQLGAVKADGEEPVFRPGEAVVISRRFPIGHYRVPQYIRGKHAVIESIIEPRAVNNEEEGFGRNAGPESAIIIALRFRWRIYGPATPAAPQTGFASRFSRNGWKGAK